MPICKKCNEKFPFWIVVDGKRRNLGSRDYCPVCSPFGKHNTKILIEGLKKPARENTNEILECVGCFREYLYKPSKGTTTKMCGSCNVLKARTKQKIKAVEYKGGKCIRCGYSKRLAALTFHHRLPGAKEFQISCGSCRSWERVRAELDKCDLLCSNCHLELHGEPLMERVARLLSF